MGSQCSTSIDLPEDKIKDFKNENENKTENKEEDDLLPAKVESVSRIIEGFLDVKFLHHWGVLVTYKYASGDNDIFLYECGKDPTDGLIKAEKMTWNRARNKSWKHWNKNNKRTVIDELQLSPTHMEYFCEFITEQKFRYNAIVYNCHWFVKQFLSYATLGSKKIISVSSPGLSVQETSRLVLASSKASSRYFSTKIVFHYVKRLHVSLLITDENVKKFVWETIKYDYKGSTFSMLKHVKALMADKSLNKLTKEIVDVAKDKLVTGEVLTKQGKVIEDVVKSSGGFRTNWQIINVLIEPLVYILVRQLSKSVNKEAIAVLCSKATSLVSTGLVGFSCGGPYGALGGVAWWVASEIVFYFFHHLLNLAFKYAPTVTLFGEKYHPSSISLGEANWDVAHKYFLAMSPSE